MLVAMGTLCISHRRSRFCSVRLAASAFSGSRKNSTSSETEQEQRKYHLRAMLVREMRTMPERGDPEDEF